MLMLADFFCRFFFAKKARETGALAGLDIARREMIEAILSVSRTQFRTRNQDRH
jgi:hypothetical protein